jgi:hypothetical protein
MEAIGIIDQARFHAALAYGRDKSGDTLESVKDAMRYVCDVCMYVYVCVCVCVCVCMYVCV